MAKSTTPNQPSQSIVELRCQHLRDSIVKDLKLIKEYEDKLRLADNPTEIARCEGELAKLEKLRARHEREYEQLCNDITEPVDSIPFERPAFPDALITSLPFPLAAPCEGYNQSEQSDKAFRELDRLLNNLIRYLVAVSLAEFRHAQPASPHLVTWMHKLSRRFVSDWLDVISAVCQQSQSNDLDLVLEDSIWEELGEAVPNDHPLAEAVEDLQQRLGRDRGDAVTPRLFLEMLVEYREHGWAVGDLHLAPMFYQALVPILQPAMQALLQELSVLRNHRLAFADHAHFDGERNTWEYDMAAWQGPDPRPNRNNDCELEGEKTHPPAKLRRLYLCDAAGKPVLNLHPWLIHYRDQLYFLELTDGGTELIFSAGYGGGIFRPKPHLQDSLNSMAIKKATESVSNPSCYLEKVI